MLDMISGMARKIFDSKVFRSRPLFSLPQVVFFMVIAVWIVISIDLNNRAQAGRLVGQGEEALQVQIDNEITRNVELQATYEYVNSDSYISSYAHSEARLILPGERLIVPILQEATPGPTPLAATTPDPAIQARPWQAWWRLLSDAPQPTR